MNPINNSGKELETDLRNWLVEKDIPFTQSADGPKADIDFIIHSKKPMYIECHNQNTKGSVDEKIPHKVYKYWDKHKMKEIWIVKGKYPLNKRIKGHIKLLETLCEIEVKIETLDSIKNKVISNPIQRNKFF